MHRLAVNLGALGHPRVDPNALRVDVSVLGTDRGALGVDLGLWE